MAETRAVVVRFDPAVLARVDAAAKARRWSRNTWLVWAAQNALGDVAGGVSDAPEPQPRSSPRQSVVGTPLPKIAARRVR